MRGLLCPAAAAASQPAPQLKKVIFPKKFPYCNSARILHFLYPQTSLRLLTFKKIFKKINFIKFFKVCVWRKFCKFLKKNSNAFWKDPFGKKSQKFLFPVSLGCPETFLEEKRKKERLAASAGAGSSVGGLGGLARGKP